MYSLEWLLSFLAMVAVQVIGPAFLKLSQNKKPTYQFSSAALLATVECFKCFLSFIMFFGAQEGPAQLRPNIFLQQLKNSVDVNVMLRIMLLAVLYFVVNQLSLFVQVLVDPGTNLLFKSATGICVALLYWAFFGAILKEVEIYAVLFLSMGSIIVQVDSCTGLALYSPPVYILNALKIICSSLASIINSKMIREETVPMHILNVLLYFMGTILNTSAQFVLAPGESFFQGFSLFTWLIVFTYTLSGLVISFAYKHAGPMSKSFSVALATVFLIIIGVHFNWNTVPDLHGILGVLLILVSNLMFTRFKSSGS